MSALSTRAQEVIARCTAGAASLAQHAAVSGLLRTPPWGLVTREDYETLAAESEYAAWTLVNGFALNHTTVSVHRLGATGVGSIEDVNALLAQQARLRLCSCSVQAQSELVVAARRALR